MSTFDERLKAVVAKAGARVRTAFVISATEVHRSVQSGSELTGAPGQPVDTGNLRNSIQLDFVAPLIAEIKTNVEYARPIEDGHGPNGPLELQSSVGGFHSFEYTRTGFRRIMEHSFAEAKAAHP